MGLCRPLNNTEVGVANPEVDNYSVMKVIT